ncbi:alpha/beta hydrolase family protein [Flavobacterium humi]|uniref:S9 family peptidase n=1 Tax=Flavobacterium humi TaxID=2562683 RepID=A0A4Z0LA56_9FLAO|nr:prolyl oligopeptidase family serine peptidase [Flavobacterium humi]TGD58970.1 S9 family peptidase [Flavobacterium humi]
MIYIIYNCKIIWISIILFLTTCPVKGQVEKTRQLTSNDYPLWSTLKPENISNNGHWVSYSLCYESKLDTLFVRSTTTAKTFVFPKGYDGKFITDSWYGCMLPEDKFQLVDLQTGALQKFENVKSFSICNQYYIFYCTDEEDKIKIVVKNQKGQILESVNNVTSYSLSPSNNTLAFCTSTKMHNSIGLIQLSEKKIRTVIKESTEKIFGNIIWQEKGKSLAFAGSSLHAKSSAAESVLFYNIEDKELFQYDTTLEKSWPTGRLLAVNYTSSLGISKDGMKVFFTTNKKPAENDANDNLKVQIWNAKDKELFAFGKKYGNAQDYPRLVMWEPKSNLFAEIGNDLHPLAILNGNQQYALVYHPDDNKPSFKQETDIDYFLLNLKTNKKTLFLKGQTSVLGSLYFSPQGKYVVYFREYNWWVYSFATQNHINITARIPASFYDDSSDRPQEPMPYGCAGFTVNDETILLYDQFDIWQFKLNEQVAKRLTNGRENKQIFRLADSDKGNIDDIIRNDKIINLNSDLLLKVQSIDNRESGYFNLDKKQRLQTLVYEPKLISALFKAEKSNTYVYQKEDFNEPPALLVKKDNGLTKSIYKSNPQHNHYGWGTLKLIEYKNSKAVNLKGVLFYPFNYDPNRKYPMIVYIYERQTKALHTYTNPSLLNGSAFNPTNFTSRGYFVLFPDIEYEIGNPGFSASDCVIAATQTATESAPIDKTKIGVMGHSFGGYETNFIITQTDMFAAAVAGAGVSDLTSCYLSVGWADIKPNARRFEYDQMRMGKTLFNNYEGYQKNSPINFAANITTPLLSYTGGDDRQVNPYQTMEFHLALRRLQKDNIMLIYPKENHVIQNPENQINLTEKITQWFDYYLKGSAKPEWFEQK